MLTTCYPWLHMLFTKKKINKKKEERNVYVKNTEIRLMILEWLSFRNEFHSSSEWISYSKRVRATSASAILAKTVLKVGWYLKLLTSSPRSQYPVSRVASIFPKKEILPSLPLPDLPRKIEGDSWFAGYDPKGSKRSAALTKKWKANTEWQKSIHSVYEKYNEI